MIFAHLPLAGHPYLQVGHDKKMARECNVAPRQIGLTPEFACGGTRLVTVGLTREQRLFKSIKSERTCSLIL